MPVSANSVLTDSEDADLGRVDCMAVVKGDNALVNVHRSLPDTLYFAKGRQCTAYPSHYMLQWGT